MPRRIRGEFVIVLDEETRSKLQEMAVHPKIYCQNIVLAHRPLPDVVRIYQARVGDTRKFRMTTIRHDNLGQVVLVEGVASEQTPHITVSCAKHITPAYSWTLMTKGTNITALDMQGSGTVQYIPFK